MQEFAVDVSEKRETPPLITELWSITKFDGAELSAYAESLMFSDIQRGLAVLGFVSMVILAAASLAYSLLDFDLVYVHSCSVLAILSLHVAISARVLTETRAVYLLGTTLLVANGLAFVLLAHQTGTLDAALFAAVVLLFLVMPLVPWGLRDALLIVGLIYLLFTISTLSVSGRFESNTLWMLQLAMIAGGGTTLTVIAHNILIRRDDIKARYELEKAHDRMETLSLKDPMTGAWNRRYLEQHFSAIRARYAAKSMAMQFALIDIDDFKSINDTRGHQYGDLVLRRLVANYLEIFTSDEHLIRLGGDEFLILLPSVDADNLVERGVTALTNDPELLSEGNDSKITVSIGLVEVALVCELSLDAIYRRADEALYRAKCDKGKPQRTFAQRTEIGVSA